MLRNYFLVAWRSIRKHKAFTAINVIGLAMSMSVCLLLILLVYDHFSYDDFHPKGDRIYRVLTYPKGEKGPFESGYATSPLPMGQSLKELYPFVEEVVNMNNTFGGEFRSNEKIINLKTETDGRSLFASPTFFSAFGFKLQQGSEATALKEPYSLVLTQEMANLLFPSGNAIGQNVEVEEFGSYTVTGVLQDPPGKSHIKFKALASFSTLPLLKNDKKIDEEYDSWNTIWSNYNYLVLHNSSDALKAEEALNLLAEENIQLEPDETGYSFELQAMNDVVPGRLLSNEISFTLPRIMLMFFGFLALIVIITASINYANLSIALSLTRIKEVGIRKTNGASRGQIISQFLLESIIIAMISLLVSIGIYKILIEQFNSLWVFNQIGITLKDSIYAYLFFFVFTLLLGLITGIGPSLFVSRIDTIQSLKGSLNSSFSRGKGIGRFFSGKKIMLGIQFSLSLIMLISIFLLRDQADYLTKASYGFDEEMIYYVALQGHKPEVIASEFGSNAGVENISFTSHHPATGRSHGSGFRRKTNDEPIAIYYFSVDHNYIPTMNLELIAGEDFPKSSSDQEKFIIINELASKRLGFESPNDAIGEPLLTEEDKSLQIIGVVKDYHWEPLMKSIEPLMLRIQPENYQYAYFQTSLEHPAEFDHQISKQWTAFDSSREFEGGYLDEEINQFYQFMYDLGGILTYVSLIAIAITILGFLGMISFHLKTRVKEIGIRKVLGATFGQLAITMSKGFLIMLAITALIAIPLAILINGLWINAMAVHSPIGLFNVGPAILIVSILAMLIILSQVWKTAKTNPADSLRSE